MNEPIRSYATGLRRHRAKAVVCLVGLLAVVLAAIGLSGYVCDRAAAGRMFRSLDQIPSNQVALVLGTSRLTAHRHPNLHFTQRITAAVSLYESGKVQHLLVSGDNHVAGYDEPTDMRDALVAAGVPTNAITCDYAGFRTLDSVVRTRTIFGLKQFTVVTEEFHCPRALWIAREHGLDVVAFAAPDLSARWSARVKAREALARVLCGLDLYVLHRQPRFSGPPEPIAIAQAGK